MIFQYTPKVFKYKNVRWDMDFIDEDGETANAYIYACVPGISRLPCAHETEAYPRNGYDIACDTWRVEAVYERIKGQWIKGIDRYQDGEYEETLDGRISEAPPQPIKSLTNALVSFCSSIPFKVAK